MEDSWVELRVHGVSGTPPESMLDFQRCRQVAGDEFGRIFQRFDETGAAFLAQDGHTIEAYHWGKFTSGSWSQAVWLVLAPFGILNAAQFTLEPPRRTWSKFLHTLAGALLRLIGVGLTSLFVIGTAVVTVDLWAWQRIGPGQTGLYRYAIAIGLLGPPLVLLMCYRLGRSRLVGVKPAGVEESEDAIDRRTAFRLRHDERRRGDRSKLDEATGHRPDGPFWERRPPSDLTRPGFLGNDGQAPALRWFHLGIGLSIVAAIGFAPAEHEGWTRLGFWASVVLLIFLGSAVVVVGDPEKSASVPWKSERLQKIKRWVHSSARPVAKCGALLAGGATALAVVHAAASSSSRGSFDHYPGIERAAYLTVPASIASLLLLAFVNLLLVISVRSDGAREHPKFAPIAGGFACTLLASLAIFLGVGFVGALGVAAAKAFETDAAETRAPELLQRVVYAWGLTALLLVALVILALVDRRLSKQRLVPRLKQDFTREECRVPPRWIGYIGSAVWQARLKNRLALLLTTFFVVGTLLSLATWYEVAPQWTDRSLQQLPAGLNWLTQSEQAPDAATGAIMWLGTLTLAGLAAGLFTAGRSALFGEEKRRGLNVLWDVISFWPRSVHPFVPPAYSHRAVRDIEDRIRWHLRNGGPSQRRRVVLCGHSQGSLLAFTAMLRLACGTDAESTSHISPPLDLTGDQVLAEGGSTPPDVSGDQVLEQVGLLTFGSQLQVLFARGFPAYVNYPSIRWLWEGLDSAWRNLYRDTDHLAGPVLSWDHDWSSWVKGTQTRWWRSIETQERGDDGPVVPRPLPGGGCAFGPDWRLLDPRLPDKPLQQRPLSELRRHSEYWIEPAWDAAIQEIRRTDPGAMGVEVGSEEDLAREVDGRDPERRTAPVTWC